MIVNTVRCLQSTLIYYPGPFLLVMTTVQHKKNYLIKIKQFRRNRLHDIVLHGFFSNCLSCYQDCQRLNTVERSAYHQYKCSRASIYNLYNTHYLWTYIICWQRFAPCFYGHTISHTRDCVTLLS